MVLIQFELTEKARKKLEGFMFINDCSSKGDAANLVFERLDLKEDMNLWLEEDNKNGEV